MLNIEPFSEKLFSKESTVNIQQHVSGGRNLNYIAVSIQYPSSPPDLTLKSTSVLLTKSEADNVIELTNICELELVS